MNEQEFAELAAGYALNALSPEDRAAFETALAQHPEWERQLSADAATAAALADGVARVQPPSAVRDALFARIATTPQEAGVPAEEPATGEAVETSAATALILPAVEPASPITETAQSPTQTVAPDTETIQTISRRSWTRGMLGLAASLVLLVGLGFGAVSLGQLLNRPAAVVALEQIENAPDAQSATTELEDGGDATVHWSESVGKVVLISNGLPSIADDESFELWYIRDEGPVPAGTFDSADATVLLDGTMEPGDVIAVTVEQQGGSSTGEPTSEPIVAIPTST